MTTAIRGGMVVDGTGAAPVRADVVIDGALLALEKVRLLATAICR